jgi:hypothetical protein
LKFKEIKCRVLVGKEVLTRALSFSEQHLEKYLGE